jgi:hypothetical protein
MSGDAEDDDAPPRCPDYDAIIELAAKLDRPALTLIALSDQNDPFYLNASRQAMAHWFAQIWAVLDPPDGVHLRRLHYRLVVLPEGERQRWDGEPYQNTVNDWKQFSRGATDARAHKLVDESMFTDRRAGEPVYLANEGDGDHDGSVSVWVSAPAGLPPPEAFRFDYMRQEYAFPAIRAHIHVAEPTLAEPYAIEIWAEKSTMNDVLEPLARRRNVTFVTGLGELSWTHCVWCVQRVLAHRKPTRILYVSDFDPSGQHMPVSVARKIEYLLRRDGHDDLDIKLDPVALTKEQVEEYELPRIPIKDTDKGKQAFEDRHGEGAVELDALEALRPGALSAIVEAAIDRYREPTREARAENHEIASQANEDAWSIRGEVLAEFEDEIAELRQAFDRMQADIAPHQDAIAAIAAAAAQQRSAILAEAGARIQTIENEANERSQAHVDAINEATAAVYERASELKDEIETELEGQAPAYDDFDWVSPEPVEDEDNEPPLFDSIRDYVDQIGHYKAHQGKPTTWRGRGRRGRRPAKAGDRGAP